VGGLSWQTTEESLRWHFEQYGPVVSVEVMRDRVTGDPRGFAFVVFGDGATVDLVMAEAKHEINHKIVDVKRAQARGIAPPSIHEKAGGEPADEESSEKGPSENRDKNKPTPEQLHNKVFVGGKRKAVCYFVLSNTS
jgi:RNA-binding protein Musashi